MKETLKAILYSRASGWGFAVRLIASDVRVVVDEDVDDDGAALVVIAGGGRSRGAVRARVTASGTSGRFASRGGCCRT